MNVSYHSQNVSKYKFDACVFSKCISLSNPEQSRYISYKVQYIPSEQKLLLNYKIRLNKKYNNTVTPSRDQLSVVITSLFTLPARNLSLLSVQLRIIEELKISY